MHVVLFSVFFIFVSASMHCMCMYVPVHKFYIFITDHKNSE